jgi:NtrC-family two-component system sensor histidine kinase KinB
MLLLVAVISIISLFQLGGAIDIIIKENLPSALAGETMSDELTQIHLFILSEPETVFQDGGGNIDQLSHNFTESLIKAKNNITISGEGEIVGGIERSFKNYREIIATFKSQGFNPTTQIDLQSAYLETIRLIKQLIAANIRAIIEADDNARALAKNRSIWMIFLALVGFFSGFYLIRIVKNKFTEPISDMLLNLRRVNFGDHHIRLSKQEGELGELAEYINSLLDQIKLDQSATLNFAFEQRDLLNALGETFDIPLFVFDLSFRFIFANEKANLILREVSNDTIEKKISDLIRKGENTKILLKSKEFEPRVLVLRDRNHNKIGYSVTLKESRS